MAVVALYHKYNTKPMYQVGNFRFFDIFAKNQYMTKFLINCILLLQFALCAAQQKEPVASGIVTHKDGKMAGFRELQFINGKVLYYNISTRKSELYEMSEIVSIADDNQKILYKDGTHYENKPEPSKIVNDTLYKPNYPEGIYTTKEDFLARKPSYNEPVIPISVRGDDYYTDTIEDHCFFIKINESKIRRVFAISYKGHLYFRIGAILDNRNKTDRAQDTDFPQSFARVLMGGENYYYLEANLTNIWARGAAYGGFGGIVGSSLANSWKYKKGIVWDIKNIEFNIFKNCKDYNDFIKAKLSDAVQQCKENQPELHEVRKAIWRIK